jgi:hypothetical protein
MNSSARGAEDSSRFRRIKGTIVGSLSVIEADPQIAVFDFGVSLRTHEAKTQKWSVYCT